MDSDIEFNIINKLAKDSLVRNFSFVDGVKYLVIDPELLKPLDCLMTYSELKKFGIDKVFICEETMSKSPEERHAQWIYIVRPDIKHLRMIARHINDDLKAGPIRTKRHILFSPQKLYICEVILEEEGVYEYVSFGELELGLIQLDKNILSMEFKDFFKNYYLHGDQSLFSSIAKSLVTIESLFGSALHVHLHGNCAKSVYKLMKTFADKNNDPVKNTTIQIGHLIVIDRTVDFVTPFCTPLNYEGLLDDVYNINAGFVTIQNENATEKKTLKLSNDDPIFKEIRYAHFTDVFVHLKDKLRELKDAEEKKNQNASVSDMKDFVQNDLKKILKYRELVDVHLKACEELINKKSKIDISMYLSHEHNILNGVDHKRSLEYIEELINRRSDKYLALRLMILLSVTNCGLAQSEFSSLSTQFLQSYGFDNLIVLNKLQKMGLFDSSDSISKEDSKTNLLKTEFTSKLVQQFSRGTKLNSYQHIKKKLNIVSSDANKSKYGRDMSYLFNNNYNPIICKYIEQILSTDRSNPQKVKELEDLFPGEYEYHPLRQMSVRAKQGANAAKTVFVYFLGGCAYHEIATLNILAKQKYYDFFYATTGFISTTSFIKTLEEK